MNPPGAMPIFGRQGKPTPEPDPDGEDVSRDELSEEQIDIIGNRWRNLTDSPETGGGGFSPEEALRLCENPWLDWHYAAYLRAKGCPFETIVRLTS